MSIANLANAQLLISSFTHPNRSSIPPSSGNPQMDADPLNAGPLKSPRVPALPSLDRPPPTLPLSLSLVVANEAVVASETSPGKTADQEFERALAARRAKAPFKKDATPLGPTTKVSGANKPSASGGVGFGGAPAAAPSSSCVPPVPFFRPTAKAPKNNDDAAAATTNALDLSDDDDEGNDDDNEEEKPPSTAQWGGLSPRVQSSQSDRGALRLPPPSSQSRPSLLPSSAPGLHSSSDSGSRPRAVVGKAANPNPVYTLSQLSEMSMIKIPPDRFLTPVQALALVTAANRKITNRAREALSRGETLPQADQHADGSSSSSSSSSGSSSSSSSSNSSSSHPFSSAVAAASAAAALTINPNNPSALLFPPPSLLAPPVYRPQDFDIDDDLDLPRAYVVDVREQAEIATHECKDEGKASLLSGVSSGGGRRPDDKTVGEGSTHGRSSGPTHDPSDGGGGPTFAPYVLNPKKASSALPPPPGGPVARPVQVKAPTRATVIRGSVPFPLFAILRIKRDVLELRDEENGKQRGGDGGADDVPAHEAEPDASSSSSSSSDSSLQRSRSKPPQSLDSVLDVVGSSSLLPPPLNLTSSPRSRLTLILACTDGRKSLLAYEALTRPPLCFKNVYVVRGGVREWVKDSLPIMSFGGTAQEDLSSDSEDDGKKKKN